MKKALRTIWGIVISVLVMTVVWICWSLLSHRMPWQKHWETEHQLTVVTYNTNGMLVDKKLEDKLAMLDYVKKLDADIVCLQEASFNNSVSKIFLSEKVFRKAMTEYPYFNQYVAKGNGWICLSRYPILSARMINYESANNGSMAYELKVGADTLLLINNHLESNKLTLDDRTAYREMIVNPQEEALKSTSKRLIGKVSEAASIRANQANKVSQYIRESGHKYVVSCGDFNDSPLSYAHRIIGEGMNDAFIESGNGLGISYHRNGFYFRIDHILASDNIELYNCKIDNSIKASDHYPIWCYIRKK